MAGGMGGCAGARWGSAGVPTGSSTLGLACGVRRLPPRFTDLPWSATPRVWAMSPPRRGSSTLSMLEALRQE